MTRLAVGLAAVALLLGALLAVLRGPGVVLLGVAVLGLLYSLPGVQLSARGVGETGGCKQLRRTAVLGTVWLQAGHVDFGVVLICLPASSWAAAILITNVVPDIEADRCADKRTLVAGRARLQQSIELTLAIHAFGCVLLIVAILV